MILACHFSYGQHGQTILIDLNNKQLKKINNLPPSNLGIGEKPIYLHADDQSCYIFNPKKQAIEHVDALQEDTWAAYPYYDTKQAYAWYVIDGDKDTGNEPVLCPGGGSPVIVIKQDKIPKLMGTVCLGRGHHVVNFVNPSDKYPNYQRLAYVSNLLEGSICVLNNNPDGDQFLSHIHTIKLPEGDNAFPHGMVYSDYTGLLYNLSNGSGNISVINPIDHSIVDSIHMPVASNLLLSRDGKYIIGKGADRKADPNHVIGRISILDLTSNKIIKTVDLPDIYPSTYQFDFAGDHLYVSTAMTGKGVQKDNLKINELLVFNTNFSDFKLNHTIKVGKTSTSRRPLAFHGSEQSTQILVPNLSDGTFSFVDSNSHQVIDTLQAFDQGAKEATFSYWQNGFWGT